MPQGYYTIEQWTRTKRGGPPEWVAILHLPFGESLTAAEKAIERLGKPGFYRLVQTQRVVWAEIEGSKLRLRKSHAGSPESLDGMRQIFERTGGVYPAEEAREARRRAKQNRDSV
jgi:hypothetical protein